MFLLLVIQSASLVALWFFSSCSVLFPRPTPFGSSALRRVPSAFSPVAEGVVDEVKGPVVAGVGRLLPFWEPLHEVDLALVLPRARALPRPPTPRERHVPALVAGVPQCCVVVLQHNLGEDAVAALTVFLQSNGNNTVSLGPFTCFVQKRHLRYRNSYVCLCSLCVHTISLAPDRHSICYSYYRSAVFETNLLLSNYLL